MDILEFVKRIPDKYEDFYITINKNRVFLKDLDIIKKLLKRQTFYGLYNPFLTGIMLIYREKGFRPYLKILAEDYKSASNLIKFLIWNHSHEDLFIKIKKDNPINKIMRKYGFIFHGGRGSEILLTRKGTKQKPIKRSKNYGKGNP